MIHRLSTQGMSHIVLQDPKAALISCAKYGLGFQGLNASQVVLALRVYAVERIQAQWRAFYPRRRFAPKMCALRKLARRERALGANLRSRAFLGWVSAHKRHMLVTRGTRWAFCVWKAEVSRLRARAVLFRGTFWPLFVWRRWTNYRISSRDKVCLRRSVSGRYAQNSLSSIVRMSVTVSHIDQNVVGAAVSCASESAAISRTLARTWYIGGLPTHGRRPGIFFFFLNPKGSSSRMKESIGSEDWTGSLKIRQRLLADFEYVPSQATGSYPSPLAPCPSPLARRSFPTR